MAWIEVIGLDRATGMLKAQYDAALRRAGRIWNIVSIMSQNPRTLKASMDIYGAVLHGPSRSAADNGRCWRWWSRPGTGASTEYALMHTTSGPRSNGTLESRATPPWMRSWAR